MKKKFLSLTLGSLLVSALSAEDNGFFCERGLSNRRIRSNGEKHQRHSRSFR